MDATRRVGLPDGVGHNCFTDQRGYWLAEWVTVLYKGFSTSLSRE